MDKYVENLPINKIRSLDNVRIRNKETDNDIPQLMESIKQHGLIHPIKVKKHGNEFLLQAGNRRLAAYIKLGYLTIPAFVEEESKIDDFKKFSTINLIENLHRANLKPIEEGRFYYKLHEEFGESISEIAVRTNQARSRVESAIRVYASLPENLRESIKPVDGKQRRKGSLGIPLDIAEYIGNRHFKKETIEKVFALIKKQELPMEKVRLLCQFVNAGISIEEAEKQLNHYIVKSFKIIVSKEGIAKLREKGETFTSYTLKLLRSTQEGKTLFYNLKTLKKIKQISHEQTTRNLQMG